MYSIKIMSSENLADSDVGKGFKMILVDAGDTFEFGHNAQGEPVVTVNINKGDEGSSIEYPVTGNAYVMSQTGKTVASFWARNKQVVSVTLDPEDPDPTATVEAIQSIVKEYAARAFPNGSIGPSLIGKALNDDDLQKTYRIRVAERMAAGQSQSEAMAAEAYLFEKAVVNLNRPG